MKNLKNLKALLYVFAAVLLLISAGLFSACHHDKTPKAETFTIIYETEFDVPPYELKLKKNTELTQVHLPDLSADEYEFLGWYLITETEESVTETKVEPGYILTENITLTAKWKKIAYFIHYTTERGEYSKIEKLNENDVIDDILLAAPDITVEGYEFSGWYIVTETGATKVEPGVLTVSEEGITLTAKWEILRFTVSYQSDFAEIPASFVVDYGTLFDSSQLPVLRGVRGATFEGWYFGNELVKEGKKVTSDMVLTAKWTINGCAVIYRTEHGTAPKGLVVTAGTVLGENELPELTAEGFTFLGWYIGAREARPGEVTVGEEGVILEAEWEAIKCRITYETNIGTAPSKKDLNWGTLLDSSALPVLTSTGNEFKGWYLSDELISTGFKITGDITLTARWEKIKCTISYASSYGSAPEEFILEYGDKILSEKLPELTDENWIFKGWYLISGTEETKIEGGTYTVTASIVLTAKWECKTASTQLDIELDSDMNNDINVWLDTNIWDEEEDCNIYTFKATEDYSSYRWYVDGKRQAGFNDNTFTICDKEIPHGVYNITVIATDENGKTMSASVQYNID